MVRVFIKGGVWKNSEDEILKAAIMKYGKQQWARVASLLNRKSAKQCKARWNEWLDPSIRKVEWSRAEDEKLLHLAKLMPAQWRTIGPLVGGRTSVQCQERYETLLDEAANMESGGDGGGKDDGTEGEGGGAASSSARKLRVGDIDPHPETKPARPDPIDMDEDEIEMLQEARARLANTQGKKAKRKAREKMLNEAKRLADLQKRRELKQAGLLSSAARSKSRGGKKRRRQIDYGVEIPFHKPAPSGFHSTAEEDERADLERSKRQKSIDFKKVNEAQYNARDREEKNAQKKEEARLRALEKSNMQYVVAEVSKRNDPAAARKRGILSMPAPGVTDEELEKVAKLTKEQRADDTAMLTGSGNGNVTDALLGDYTDRPLPTPMRTPMTAAGKSSQEVIMREASNLRLLQSGQTPLLGGDNPELMEGGAGTGVGLKSAATAAAATPMIGGSATPMSAYAERDTMSQTPMTMTNSKRDQLGLNRPNSRMHPGMEGGDGGDDVSISATSFATSVGERSLSIKEMARAERRAAKRARKELEIALANLPAPQFEYELAVPDAITDDDERDDAKPQTEQDAAELEAEELARLEQEAAKLYAKRSSVVKRLDLPRPTGAINEDLIFQSTSSKEGNETAQQLLDEELLVLLQHDAFKHPFVRIDEDFENDKKKSKKGKKKRKKSQSTTAPAGPPKRPLGYIEEEYLDMAKELLEEEYETVIQEKRSIVSNNGSFIESENQVQVILKTNTIKQSIDSVSDHMFVDGDDNCPNMWVTASESCSDKISSLETEYTAIKTKVEAMRKKTNKLEAKLSIVNGGYTKRDAVLNTAILQDFAEYQNSRIEEKVYKVLMQHEQRGMADRIDKLQVECEELEKVEASLQKQYGDFLHEKNRHKLLLKQRQEKETSK